MEDSDRELAGVAGCGCLRGAGRSCIAQHEFVDVRSESPRRYLPTRLSSLARDGCRPEAVSVRTDHDLQRRHGTERVHIEREAVGRWSGRDLERDPRFWADRPQRLFSTPSRGLEARHEHANRFESSGDDGHPVGHAPESHALGEYRCAFLQARRSEANGCSPLFRCAGNRRRGERFPFGAQAPRGESVAIDRGDDGGCGRPRHSQHRGQETRAGVAGGQPELESAPTRRQRRNTLGPVRAAPEAGRSIETQGEAGWRWRGRYCQGLFPRRLMVGARGRARGAARRCGTRWAAICGSDEEAKGEPEERPRPTAQAGESQGPVSSSARRPIQVHQVRNEGNGST